MLTIWVLTYGIEVLIIAWALVGLARLIGKLEKRIDAFQADDNLDDRYSRGVSLALARLARRVEKLEKH